MTRLTTMACKLSIALILIGSVSFPGSVLAERARKLPADSYISTVKIEVAAARNLQGQPKAKEVRLGNAEAMVDSCLMYYSPYPSAFFWKADIYSTRFEDVGELSQKAKYLATFLIYADSLKSSCGNTAIKQSARKDCDLQVAVTDSTRLRIWRDIYNNALTQARQLDTLNLNIADASDSTKGTVDSVFIAELNKGRTATADSALANFKMAIQIDEQNGDAYIGLGNVATAMGRFDEATTFLKQALEKTTPEKRSPLVYNLAYMYAQKNDYCHAAPYFSEYWKLNPNDSEVAQNLAICFSNCNQPDSALAVYRKILASNPSYSEAYNALGEHFVNQARDLQAPINAARDAKKDADLTRLTTERDNARDSARVYLKKYFEAKPDDAPAAFQYGLMAYATNKIDDAIGALEKAVTLKPDYADALITLGDLYQGKAKFDEAISAYEKALAVQSDNKALMESLKVLYTDLGKTDKLNALLKKMK